MVQQELRNAAYYGPFVTLAREVFSNTGNANMSRWQTYVKGNPKRQAILETALSWVSGGNIDDYMAKHRYDNDINEIQNYFSTVIDWIDSVFDYTGSEMCGQEWGRLYETYHRNSYRKSEVSSRVRELMSDPQINNKRGIFEYILGGETDTRLLNVRVFGKKTITEVYEAQTKKAEDEGISNCPLCALTNGPNRTRIYKLSEMDADHVTAWSRGGATNASNCQMLCKTHNRAKGNR